MLCALSNKLSYKKFSKTIDLMGDLRGLRPPSQRMGIFKAEGLFLGRAEKMKKNKYFQNY